MNTIYRRIKNDTGKWRYVAVNTGRGRRPEGLEGSKFYTRIKKRGDKWQSWIALDGATLPEAVASAEQLERGLEAREAGFKIGTLDDVANNDRLITKIEKYLDETKANKSKATYRHYSMSLHYFEEYCKRVLVTDVDREDLLKFKTYLIGFEFRERTIANHFLNVLVFLNWCGVKTSVKPEDWPKRVERDVEEYSDAELTAMLKAANENERLLLNAFLCSGLRTGEMCHLTYGDIDFEHSIWKVRPKDDWQTKTPGSQREVPVPSWLTEKIRQRKLFNKRTNSDLIFPNTLDAPEENMIRFVRRVAKRAKVTGRADDHKFRSTAITRWLRAGNSVQDVMVWVGHKNLKVILRYAARIDIRKPENRLKAEQPFAEFALIGG